MRVDGLVLRPATGLLLDAEVFQCQPLMLS